MKINIDVINQRLKINTNAKNLVSGSQNFVKFFFNLDSDWDGLRVFAQFRQGDNAYNQFLDEEKSVYLPAEIIEGTVDLSLKGTGETKIATVNYLTFDVDKSIVVSNAQSTEISTSLYEQLSDRVSALVASPAGSGGDVGTELRDIRETGKGIEFSAAGDAVRASVQGINSYLNVAGWASYYYDFNNLPNNIIIPCGVDNTPGAIEAAPNGIVHSPVATGGMTGLIVTLGRNSERKNGDIQLWFPWHGGTLMYRQYNVTDGAGSAATWSAWVTGNESPISRLSAIETAVSGLPQYRAEINANHAIYDNKLSRCKIEGTFIATQSRSENGADVVCWTDLPNSSAEGFVVTNSRYSNYILQRAVGVESGAAYNRIIHKDSIDDSGTGLNKAVYHDWICENPDVFLLKKKLLAVGDSICYGFRNGWKGFVGDLGMQYQNKGISATTLSNVIDGTVDGKDRTCIPKQLKRVHDDTPNYKPDIIIGEGGINDYFQSAALGAIPAVPVTDDNGADDLDESTVMGGLQRLFYYMIKFYPEAQRYFLITHKTYAAFPHSTFNYLPATQNMAGYTQEELHDAIVACCKVYNVKVIDIYNESTINSAFSQYRSATAYSSSNPDATASEYIDADGVHPLGRGYLEGYIPLIREAIRMGAAIN